MIKDALAYTANSIFGTWHLPMGLKLPDVDGQDWTRNLHRQLTNLGGNIPLAWTRVGLTKVFSLVARGGSIALGHSIPKCTVGKGVFINLDDQEINAPTCFINFLGSGIDVIRNHATGISDSNLIADKISANGQLDVQPCTYLYETSSRHDKLSPEWFLRLKDAYQLNIQPDYVSDEARRFVRNHFLPLISEENNGVRIKRLTEVAKNSMRFTLCGQSYGGTFIQMTINALYEEMKNLKFQDSEIQDVFDNILVVNISGAAFAKDRLNRPRPKTIFMEHIYDFVGFQTDRHDTHPFYHPENISDGGIPLSNKTHFYWLDFKWKSEQHPDGVEEPAHDSYGYHDIRATLQRMPPAILNAVQKSVTIYNRGHLPDLLSLLTIERK